MKLKLILILACGLVSSCNSPTDDLAVATKSFQLKDKAGLYKLFAQNDTKRAYPTNCNSSSINNYLVGRAIDGMVTIMEFKEAGAGRAQLVAIARQEIGQNVEYHVSEQSNICKDLNTIQTEIRIRSALLLVINNIGENTAEQEIAKMSEVYKIYRSNNKVKECGKVENLSSEPIEKQAAGVNWKGTFNLLDCDSFTKSYAMPKGFVVLPQAAKIRLERKSITL